MGNIESDQRLSREDLELLRGSWQTIRKDRKVIGRCTFVQLFREDPSLIKKFRQLECIPAEQLLYHPKLVANALSVFYVVASLIDHLDDVETCRELVRKVAATHRPRNVNRQHFETFAIAFLRVISPVVSDRATQSWQRAFGCFHQLYEEACLEEDKLFLTALHSSSGEPTAAETEQPGTSAKPRKMGESDGSEGK